MPISVVLFSLLGGTLFFLFAVGKPRLGKATYPLMLLVFLATTGNMLNARVLINAVLAPLGNWQSSYGSTLWDLWRYMFGPLALVLTFWLVTEVNLRFPFQGPRLPRCRKCGYDLRGNKTGTCPECGTPVPSEHTGAGR